MKFFSYISDAWKTIMSNKMRSGLSTLGIVIGMAAVIVMMAIGQGVDDMIVKNMGDLTKNKLTVSSDGGYSKRDESGQSSSYVKSVRFTPDILSYIEDYFPELSGKLTYQIYGNSAQVTVKKTSDFVSSSGVPENWFSLNEKDLQEGPGFMKQHYDEKAFVAVVNATFKKKFYPSTSPIGKRFSFDKKDYTIVGVLEEGQWEFGSQIYIPSTTLADRINHSNEISSFEVFLDPSADNKLWNKRVSYLLLKKYNRKNASDAGFSISSFADAVEKINQTTGMMKNFLLFIGGLSLLIGGIGVMNIMIVSVTERTREIGIRKAIGALNRDIVMQFLIESIVITFIGGILALCLSFFAVRIVNSGLSQTGDEENGHLTAVINVSVVALSFVLTALTGIIFGIMPARKAAKLKPIDALRFE